jgi:hypothetical protein
MLISRPFPAPHEPGRHDAHEAGERDQLDLVDAQDLVHGPLEGLAIPVEGAVVDDCGRDAKSLSALEPAGIGPFDKTSAISAG